MRPVHFVSRCFRKIVRQSRIAIGELHDDAARRPVTPPRIERGHFRGMAGLPGDVVLMRRERRTAVRRKRVVAERVVLGHRPVRFDITFLDVRIRHLLVLLLGIVAPAGRMIAEVFTAVDPALDHTVEAVHLAVIVILEELRMAMIQHPRPLQRNRLQRVGFSVVSLAGVRAVRSRKIVEHVVERTVLLNDDDDVFEPLRRLRRRLVTERRVRTLDDACGMAETCTPDPPHAESSDAANIKASVLMM